MFLRKRLKGRLKALFMLAVMAAITAFFVLAAGVAGGGASMQGLEIAERAIRCAAVQCYALEGIYPPSYEYLREHYGVQVSERLYFVDYRFVADNLMPDITVLPQSGAAEEVTN